MVVLSSSSSNSFTRATAESISPCEGAAGAGCEVPEAGGIVELGVGEFPEDDADAELGVREFPEVESSRCAVVASSEKKVKA